MIAQQGVEDLLRFFFGSMDRLVVIGPLSRLRITANKDPDQPRPVPSGDDLSSHIFSPCVFLQRNTFGTQPL
jgi:hypothetical protein